MDAVEFKSKEKHEKDVKKIQDALRQKNHYYCLKGNYNSNALRNGNYKKEAAQIDLSEFNKILNLNIEEEWIETEPRITFYELCTFTLKYNLIPPVVPEFTTITIGGAIMGAALESSSHQFGQVNDSCLEYEFVLGNSDCIKASPTQNEDLFYGCVGSYGSLAMLTAVKMRLIRTKKWVRLTYHHFKDFKGVVNKLTAPLTDHFAEGIIYSASKGIVISGNLIDQPKEHHPFFKSRSWSPWYVQRVSNSQYPEEYMPIKDYLFRHDKGGFWIGRYIQSFWTMFRLFFHLGIPKIQLHSYNPSFLFRLLFGWSFSSKNLYKLWHRVPNHISENLFFIHDFYTPFSRAEETLELFMEQTGIFPIWLCPVKGTQTPQILSPHFGDKNFLNIGLYGIPQTHHSTVELSAQLERQIIRFGGRKMLYSFTYYDRELFDKIYSANYYENIRKKFFAENAFPSLYNKIVVRNTG